MLCKNVVEPLKVKTQAVASAADAAITIMRIDDIIAASREGRGTPPEAAAGGMPGTI